MALNLTVNVTGDDNVAIFGVCLPRFVLIAVPAFVLCVLCVAALLIAKEINWQMRVILINIFAADVLLAGKCCAVLGSSYSGKTGTR